MSIVESYINQYHDRRIARLHRDFPDVPLSDVRGDYLSALKGVSLLFDDLRGGNRTPEYVGAVLESVDGSLPERERRTGSLLVNSVFPG